MLPSERLRERAWHRTLAAGDLIPTGSATYRLSCASQDLPGGAILTDGGMAVEWFDGAPPALELDEEAVWLRRYGRVLTLLVCSARA